jgi:hypothetical protein
LPHHRFDNLGPALRCKSARAVFLADQEDDPLLVDEAAVAFCQRRRCIPVRIRSAGDPGDLDHREVLSLHERVGRGKAQTESAIMEFRHAARDGVDTRLEFGSHVAPCIAPVPVRSEAQRKKAPALRTG